MKKTFITGLILLASTAAIAQSTTPFVFNISGGSYNDPSSYYRFEWSIGELSVINTMSTVDSACTLLHGVLQPGTEKPGYALILLFEAGDYTIFPNPTRGRFEMNFFVYNPGKMELQLTDINGKILETRSYHYDGVRRIQLFDLSRYPSGMYFVVTTFTPSDRRPLDNMQVIRKGALKIIKIN